MVASVGSTNLGRVRGAGGRAGARLSTTLEALATEFETVWCKKFANLARAKELLKHRAPSLCAPTRLGRPVLRQANRAYIFRNNLLDSGLQCHAPGRKASGPSPFGPRAAAYEAPVGSGESVPFRRASTKALGSDWGAFLSVQSK